MSDIPTKLNLKRLSSVMILVGSSVLIINSIKSIYFQLSKRIYYFTGTPDSLDELLLTHRWAGWWWTTVRTLVGLAHSPISAEYFYGLKNKESVKTIPHKKLMNFQPKRPRVSRKWIRGVAVGATASMVHWSKVLWKQRLWARVVVVNQYQS